MDAIIRSTGAILCSVQPLRFPAISSSISARFESMPDAISTAYSSGGTGRAAMMVATSLEDMADS